MGSSHSKPPEEHEVVVSTTAIAITTTSYGYHPIDYQPLDVEPDPQAGVAVALVIATAASLILLAVLPNVIACFVIWHVRKLRKKYDEVAGAIAELQSNWVLRALPDAGVKLLGGVVQFELAVVQREREEFEKRVAQLEDSKLREKSSASDSDQSAPSTNAPAPRQRKTAAADQASVQPGAPTGFTTVANATTIFADMDAANHCTLDGLAPSKATTMTNAGQRQVNPTIAAPVRK